MEPHAASFEGSVKVTKKQILGLRQQLLRCPLFLFSKPVKKLHLLCGRLLLQLLQKLLLLKRKAVVCYAQGSDLLWKPYDHASRAGISEERSYSGREQI